MEKFGTENTDRINELFERNNGLTIALFVSVILNIFLIIGYINIETNVKIEMPPKFIVDNIDDVSIDISNDSASEDYYKIWGYYFINETATFTSKEITKKIQLITKAYEPSLLKTVRDEIDDKTGKEYKTSDFEELNNYAKEIRKEKITQKFIVKNVNKPEIAYGNDEATLTIEGLANQIFEKSKNNPITKDKPCNYVVSMKRSKGVLYVTGYQTNCFK